MYQHLHRNTVSNRFTNNDFSLILFYVSFFQILYLSFLLFYALLNCTRKCIKCDSEYKVKHLVRNVGVSTEVVNFPTLFFFSTNKVVHRNSYKIYNYWKILAVISLERNLGASVCVWNGQLNDSSNAYYKYTHTLTSLHLYFFHRVITADLLKNTSYSIQRRWSGSNVKIKTKNE